MSIDTKKGSSLKGSKWIVLLAVSIPTLTIEMSGTSVFVALDAISSDLGFSIEHSVWLTTMYLVTNAMMLPIAGWLGGKLGYKRTIVLSMAVFTLSALLSGFARNLESLVFFRALQGMGDGPVLPIVTALLFKIFPEKERGRMMAINMLAVGAAPALAPLLASHVVQAVGWRGIFYLTVLLGLAAILALVVLLPRTKEKEDEIRLNWPTFLLLALGTGSLQFFLDRGQSYDWFHSNIMLTLFVLAVVSLLLFVVLTIVLKEKSVLDFSTLQDLTFLVGNIANMIVFGVLYGALLIKVLYLQWLMGYTTVYVGQYQAVFVGVMILFSFIAGIITDKIHPRWAVILGLPITFYGLLLSSRLTLEHDMQSIMGIGAILATGVALITTSISTTVFSSISKTKLKEASVINSYLSVVSMSISISLAMVFLIRGIDIHAMRLAQSIRIDNLAVAQLVHRLGRESALVLVHEKLLRQAAILSFNDVLSALAFMIFLLLLYFPFMKKTQ